MSFTYIRFNSALKAQGIDKKEYLPVTSKILPYGAYWALFWSLVFILVQGYSVFLDGNWGAATFVFNYGIVSCCSASLRTESVLVFADEPDRFRCCYRPRFQDLRQDSLLS